MSRADAEKDISEYNATSSEKWRLPTKIEFQNSIKNQALPAFQSDITYWTQDGEWGTETAWLAEDDKGLNRNKEDAKRAVRLVRDVA